MRKQTLLPLLEVLKTIRPEKRIILLSHFDDQTRDGIYKTIVDVQSSARVPKSKRKRVVKTLAPFKKQLNVIAGKRYSRGAKNKSLAQMGGGPMTKVLKTAIPMMLNNLNLFPK